MARLIGTGMSVLLTIACNGCLIPIPLAVFPAACEGSGLQVEFRDTAGNKINADGLLIVHREYNSHIFYGQTQPSFDYLVRIEKGRATISTQMKLASLWWSPGLPYVLLGVPTVQPQDTLEILPIVPGYSRPLGAESAIIWEKGEEKLLSLGYDKFKDGVAELYSTFGDIAEGSGSLEYYQYIDDRLRCEHEKAVRPRAHFQEFFLPDDDYCELKRLVEAEIQGLTGRIASSREGGQE